MAEDVVRSPWEAGWADRVSREPSQLAALESGGAHCLGQGMVSDHVVGLRTVLPDGELCELGGESTQHVGPDWMGTPCGSDGQLPIALEATSAGWPSRSPCGPRSWSSIGTGRPR